MSFARTAHVILLVCLAAVTAEAQEWDSAAVGVKAGTLGLGLDGTFSLTEKVNLRINGNLFNFSYDREIDDIDYDLDLDLQTFMLLVDWHPFDNGFRVSAGAVQNNNDASLDAAPSDNETIGGTTYTPAQLGTITGDLAFDSLVPYIGIGYGNAVAPGQAWSFVFDLGLMIQDYDVDLSVSGPVALLPSFQTDLREEEAKVQDDFDDIRIYPVVSAGIAYHF